MTFFRSKRNSTITIIIFGAIILTFIFWGGQKADHIGVSSLTEVNGESIPYAEFQKRLSQELKMFGQYLNQGKLADPLVQMLERKVATGLVMRKALAQKATTMGVRVGNEEVLDILQKEKAFFDPKLNRFSPTVYQAVLQANELKASEFEASIKEELLIEKLRNLIEGAIQVSTLEVGDAFRVEKTEFALDIATFEGAKLANSKKIEITEKAVAEHFEKFKSEYMSAEKRIADVGVLDISSLTEKISVNDADIEKYFQEKIKGSKTPSIGEGVAAHALHILMSDTSARGERRAKDLLKSLRTEDEFRSAAKTLSEDYSNSAQGGDLGYFSKGMMVKPFSDAVFGASPLGKAIGPVKTNFGFHLIWVLDRTPAEVSVKARSQQIQYLIRQDRLAEKTKQLKEEVQKILTDSKDVGIALKQKGFQLSQTLPFDSKSRLASLPYLVLEEATRAPKEKWQGPQESGKSLYVYRVTSMLPPQPMSLEEARPQVVKALETELTEKLVKNLNLRIIEKKAGWEDLLKAGADTITHKGFKPFQVTQVPGFSESDVLLKLVQELRPRSPISSPVIHEGKWVVFRGTEWSSIPTDLPEGETQRLKSDLLSKKRAQVFDQYTQNLLKASKIPEEFRKKYNI